MGFLKGVPTNRRSLVLQPEGRWGNEGDEKDKALVFNID